MKRRQRRMIGIPVVIVLALLAFYSMRWGLASLDLWRATEVMKQLVSTDIPVDAKMELLEQGMQQLDRRSREHIDEMLKRAIQIQPREVMNLATSLDQVPRVCGMPEAILLKSQCERLGWKPESAEPQ